MEKLSSPPEKRIWSCYIYPQFVVLELDRGDMGASEIKIRRLSKGISPEELCKNSKQKNDILLEDFDGYFEGVFENIIFITSADSFGGIMNLSAHDAQTGKKLISTKYNSLVKSKVITKKLKGKISLSFYKPLKLSCTPTKENMACWKQILTENKVPENIKIDLPDCEAAIKGYKDDPHVQITTNVQVNDIFNPQIQYISGKATCELEP